MQSVLLLLSVVVLAGCGNAEPGKPRLTRQQRVEAAEVHLSKTPVLRTYRYADGELRVLEVPVKDPSGWAIDLQRCFIWRDEQFKTAAVSCIPMPDVLLPSQGP